MAKKSQTKTERSYNIPLRKSFMNKPVTKRTPRAARAVKQFLAKHMKTEPANVKLGMHLNQHIWSRGIKNPPHHVKVGVVKEGDVVKAELHGFEFKGAVKAEAKKEPETMKEKLAAKMGAKDEAKPDEKKQADKKASAENKKESSELTKENEKKDSAANQNK